MKINYFATFGLLFIIALNSNAADVANGKTLSATCATCHGVDGNSNTPIWPKIAGQHASYIIHELKHFKSGERVNVQMQPIALALSDKDMTDVAAYFASQKRKPGRADPESVELGQKVYRAGNAETHVPACMACHGPAGVGNPGAGYPALAGQHAPYTKKRLYAFIAEAEENDQAGKNTDNVMHQVVKGMSRAEIEAVSEYIQGLY